MSKQPTKLTYNVASSSHAEFSSYKKPYEFVLAGVKFKGYILLTPISCKINKDGLLSVLYERFIGRESICVHKHIDIVATNKMEWFVTPPSDFVATDNKWSLKIPTLF